MILCNSYWEEKSWSYSSVSDSVLALSQGWSKWQCYRMKHTVGLQVVNNNKSSTIVLRRRSHATLNYTPRKNDDKATWFKRYSGNVFIDFCCDLVSIINLYLQWCFTLHYSKSYGGFNYNYAALENFIYNL